MRLNGRKIVVTGAASGIGLAIAQKFLNEGAAVAMLDRDEARLNARAIEVKGAVALTCDVSDERSVGSAIAEARSQLGGLDGVVNCAGVDLVCHFEKMTTEDWNKVLAVDLTGPMLICRAALPALRESGFGTIVNISSGAGLRPLPGRTAYCATKAALIMLGKTLAIDLAGWNVRVNTICPGPIDTPQFWGQFEDPENRDAELAVIMERYLIKKPGKPGDIANAALFLTCHESSFVTGSTLAVEGGRTFH